MDINEVENAVLAILTRPMLHAEIVQALAEVGISSESRIRHALRSLWKFGFVKREPQRWGYLYSMNDVADPFDSRYALRPKRRERLVPFNGDLLTYGEIAECTGCRAETIEERIRKGWDMDRVLAPGNMRHRTIDIDGETHNLREWCDIFHISRKTVSRRVGSGMTYQEALLYERPLLRVTVDGREYTIRELSELTGIPVRLLHDRYRRGKRGNELTKEIKRRKKDDNTTDGNEISGS